VELRQGKAQQGKVIAAGKGKVEKDGGKVTPLDVKAGDTILWSRGFTIRGRLRSAA
jgi:co-chaperonin GroES (HSP10)